MTQDTYQEKQKEVILLARKLKEYCESRSNCKYPFLCPFRAKNQDICFLSIPGSWVNFEK